MIVPVILAGGSGTRLWPLSRQQAPKQFLKMFGDQTMLQQTIRRLEGLPDLAEPIVVCNEDHRFTVAEQLRGIGIKGQIILEPAARNTAPAIALAALQAKQMNKDEDPTLLVLPADHLIDEIAEFHRSIFLAIEKAAERALVTFGVVPTRPETGYGYIEVQGKVEAGRPSKALRFVEKPDTETAEEYLSQGSFLWNSGMFVFTADAYLESLEKYSSECYTFAKSSIGTAKSDLDFIRVDKDEFGQSPNISIDYAVMEKSDQVYSVPLDAGWSDVGCWRSYWDAQKKDADGNSIHGDAIAISTTNTLVHSADKLVATIGVDNLVVVTTSDAVLVINKNRAQDVKSAISLLSDRDRTEHLSHRKVYRPWGAYDSIDCGDRFQVKKITVNPGASLSLQMHHHRAEHWIVVKGTALVQKGEDTIMLSENQSTFIPLGVTHRLSNPGKMPLELIEVQSGSYLGEDDIVRYEDTYGRK
ncbi:mannose-1-phosphate guanylyltransferase/mannose-6-phosphate isomerase [Aurantivibrio plasticivorans]